MRGQGDGMLNKDGKRLFPIGWYDMPRDTSSLKELADAGINIIRCNSKEELDFVHSAEIQGWMKISLKEGATEEFKKEVPYCTEVQITEFQEPTPEDKNPVIRMKATIFVERESQKGIVVGKGGQQIKKVGMRARKGLEEFFQSKVHLELSVKVDKDWRSKEERLKKYGYLK